MIALHIKAISLGVIAYVLSYFVFMWIIPNAIGPAAYVVTSGELHLAFHLVGSFVPALVVVAVAKRHGLLNSAVAVAFGLAVTSVIQTAMVSRELGYPWMIIISDVVMAGLAGFYFEHRGKV